MKFFLGLLAVLFCADAAFGLTIISRKEWGAAPAKNALDKLANGKSYVIIHHTAGVFCTTKSACITQMQNIQSYHQKTQGWADIGYNFLIGGDGNIYEGRGWNVVGVHASGYNSLSLGISFMGNYNNDKPTAAQIKAAKNLLAEAVSRGQIIAKYTLYGHRQVSATECPGTNLWNEIKTWANWKTK
ncbi:peptidoglycan-recognition protein SC2-like [Musca vetustissima]|uniref:peptidoglycan-recognition protein SC2-like n=1 Tax=Musca vetustissima TaxID=27455 RepID=UPI002AB6B7D9|nr:peptidoglycan-recognition protein SC2-like [Musca vetustissima]XP_061387210.1 peptidoglycan-recognition protein SC2-like [Musca vetustissima]